MRSPRESKKSKAQSSHPRPYLSWSQLSTWERSPGSYIRSYIYGDKVQTDAMEFGSRFAEMMEQGRGDDEFTEFLSIFTSSPQREVTLTGQVGEVPILGKFDGFDKKRMIVTDHKTSMHPWTQPKADKHGQFTFYALLVYLNYGKIPIIRVQWIKTMKKRGEITLTGRHETIETKRTMQDIISMSARIKKAWKEIGTASYKEYNKLFK